MMQPGQPILFPPFCLDTANACLWRDSQVVFLRPKTFAVLRYLVEHPDRLVTTAELLAAVWGGSCVSHTVPRNSIRELRAALGDDPTTPQFIETVHKRGYRFIAPLQPSQPVQGSKFAVQGSQAQSPAPTMVGREAELGQLHGWLDAALSGAYQLVFVTGEAGIGKTTLVDAFVKQISRQADLLLARGQCVEHYGPGEAYLPLLDAWGHLCQTPESERLIAVLQQSAPLWLAQMPWLLSEGEQAGLQRQLQGVTQQRMVREMAEVLRIVTCQIPLVLVLEDLHWSDSSTWSLLAFLTRRQEPTRCLIIGTYRPQEVQEHSLEALIPELQLHGACHELPLGLLSQKQVAQYLELSLPPRTRLPALVPLVYRQTGGNPLFMVNSVDYLMAHGLVRYAQADGKYQTDLETLQLGIPNSLRQMINTQLERLDRIDQGILEAASVAGLEFSSAAVAAGLEAEAMAVEERCEALARHGQFLRASGVQEWPDGTVTAGYTFRHTLYREVLYDRVPAGKRSHLHRRIGERQEHGHGSQASTIAAELAVHFCHGRDARRAV